MPLARSPDPTADDPHEHAPMAVAAPRDAARVPGHVARRSGLPPPMTVSRTPSDLMHLPSHAAHDSPRGRSSLPHISSSHSSLAARVGPSRSGLPTNSQPNPRISKPSQTPPHSPTAPILRSPSSCLTDQLLVAALRVLAEHRGPPYSGRSPAARTRARGARERGFESRRPDHFHHSSTSECSRKPSRRLASRVQTKRSAQENGMATPGPGARTEAARAPRCSSRRALLGWGRP
jgi:hypothetical protein